MFDPNDLTGMVLFDGANGVIYVFDIHRINSIAEICDVKTTSPQMRKLFAGKNTSADP